MIYFSKFVLRSGFLAATLSAPVAVFVLGAAAGAVDLDFNAANGNYNVASNWVDTATGDPVASAPTVDDTAFVRNNGTVTINSDVASLQMRIGHIKVITAPDYNSNGFVDPLDYVLWRMGGPLANDATPPDVGEDDYTFWRSSYGLTAGQHNLGMPGTLNWTAGKITGRGIIDGDPFSGGPDIRVGRLENTSIPEVTGTVIQNGPTTELLLPYQQSQLTIGDGNVSSSAPTSSYTLMSGTIGTAIGSFDMFQPNGTNGTNGIRVKAGTFNMTGGQIIDVTPAEYKEERLRTQRFLTVASGSGTEEVLMVATANLSGGSIDSLGGIRVAASSHNRGYLNIDGPITIVTGGDSQLGANSNNAIGEMTMSDGTFQVGRTDVPNQQNDEGLPGRFHVGDSGKGILNMSGGTIHVTRDLVVANNFSAAGSIVTMTGGTIITGGLSMRRSSGADPIGGDFSASIILDGPEAVFTHTGVGNATNVRIGDQGKALFEVRQGHATLGGNGVTTQLGQNAISQATLNVKGGKLTLSGPLGRSNTSSVAPEIGLTGGILEFNGSSGQLWQTDFNNTGSQLVTKLNTLHQVTVGDATHPSNFAMSSGSWDLEIGSNATETGSDRFIVNGTGSASLTGGTLNISYIGGYTPTVNDTLTILQAPGGVTLNAGAVTLDGQSGWSLITDLVSTPRIQLLYVGPGGSGAGSVASAVPEPSAATLILFALGCLFTATRARNR